jgi:hypothetical protein
VTPRAPDGAGAAGRRTFHGNGFSLEIPENWTDLTIYTFRGPRLRKFEPIACVQTEPGAGFADAESYATARLPLALRAASGGRLLRRQSVPLGSTAEGVAAEIRWAPSREATYFQRLLYAVFEDCGFVMSANLTPHARAAIAPTLNKLFASFRPWGAGWRSSRESPRTWIGDRFRLELPEGWNDESTLLLAEPDPERFRRNLVVRRIPVEEDPGDLTLWAEAEVEILEKAAKGFELIALRETTTRDEAFAHTIDFRRETDDGDRLRQTELAAWRRGFFHTLMFTAEADPPRAVERMIQPLLRSFAAKGGARG